ncbi:hypothetical protein RFI_20321 [Reticulomyxa filosa]|uniref:Uncharacterized protein n=1 Tax=Reticulomyxa filosa TaxID=46433 RepID=X6MT65_RETFI|nr:hypothetical protein RFI_20321 [Reticulomyxa filosa]|eukprot:ETO17019.1 hypothetical protein RFI_20321 [Reticulomyxa filosa]
MLFFVLFYRYFQYVPQFGVGQQIVRYILPDISSFVHSLNFLDLKDISIKITNAVPTYKFWQKKTSHSNFSQVFETIIFMVLVRFRTMFKLIAPNSYLSIFKCWKEINFNHLGLLFNQKKDLVYDCHGHKSLWDGLKELFSFKKGSSMSQKKLIELTCQEVAGILIALCLILLICICLIKKDLEEIGLTVNPEGLLTAIKSRSARESVLTTNMEGESEFDINLCAKSKNRKITGCHKNMKIVELRLNIAEQTGLQNLLLFAGSKELSNENVKH